MNPKLIIYGVLALAFAATLTTCYIKGRTDSTQKADLQTARKVVVREREVRQIESTTNTRVDAESIDTTRKAEAADNEIERIRKNSAAVRPGVSGNRPSDGADVAPDPDRPIDHSDRDAARVMQLAREARAAAVESAAKLQSARTGAR